MPGILSIAQQLSSQLKGFFGSKSDSSTFANLFSECLSGVEDGLAGDAKNLNNTMVGLKAINIGVYSSGSSANLLPGSSDLQYPSITISGIIAETHQQNGKPVVENDSFSYTQYDTGQSGNPQSLFTIEHPNSDLNIEGDGSSPISEPASNPIAVQSSSSNVHISYKNAHDLLAEMEPQFLVSNIFELDGPLLKPNTIKS